MKNMKEIEILLVEDNLNDLELILRAFKKHNLVNKVHVAKDGSEALKHIFTQNLQAEIDIKPQVILLNWKLPKIDGLEVLKKIRSNERTKAIPVVVLIASPEERNMVENFQLSVNSYIIKPIDFDKFIHAVSEIGLYCLLLNQSQK
jgi:two-component system response regulator